MSSSANQKDPILSVQNLRTSFFTKQGEIRAVDGVSYEIRQGETLGIVGESGCGKSVTSLSIMGLLEPPGKTVGGAIDFQGQNLLKLGDPELARRRGLRMAMIFQEPMTALNPVLSIGYQISEQVMAHLGVSRGQAKERALEMLDLVGIPSPRERYDQYPHHLSGGMRQRAMIAMALSCEPSFLIADEPTTALDVTVQAQILDLLMRLQEKMQMAVQFITHDLAVISEIADRVMVMYAGQTVEMADTRELFRQPKHPYTIALLHSRPKLGERVTKLAAIEGAPPSPLSRPQGCPFQNRCPQVKAICLTEMPPLRSFAGTTDTSQVACHFPGGVN